jgi:magnesium-transporting ATPase (P-type)
VRQFASPLIYILIGAAAVALLLKEVTDAAFIAVVLLLNALISLVNEARAERKVRALAGLIHTRTRVRRGGETLVASGRGTAVVVATGAATEVGDIARQMASVESQPPPLILRMRRFARAIGVVVLGVSGFIVLLGLIRGQPLDEVLMGAIALAVSAVPEGLPIALTVALAVSVSRMASRQVVVRHLPAVEALGSCGVIATDKTGTLTRNQLTVERVAFADRRYELTGVGYEPV